MKNSFISFDTTSSPIIEKTKLLDAWEQFITGKHPKPEIRPLMLESWQRCLTQGVHPIESKAPIIKPNFVLEDYLSQHSVPTTVDVNPLINKLKDVAIDSGHMVVFSNSNGEILSLDGDVSIRTQAQEMNFLPGASWLEQHAGTNAIGTALITGKPIQVFAGEHFCQDVHKWACSAAPIRNPATQEIIAVVDLTGPWSHFHPHSLSVVVSTAYAIEEKLYRHLQFEQFKIMEHYKEESIRKPNIPMVCLDRGWKVLQASSLLYQEGWMDKNNRLVGCPDLSFPPKTKQTWESKGKNGTWYFELVPYYHENQPIGAIVHVSPPNRTARASLAIPTDTNPTTKHSFATMIGHSPEFQSVMEEARLAAKTDLPVLIEGESGTGKELLAQSIHSASSRASGPFVAVNCGAIPKELAASEFFGYEEGAFTGGAKGGRAGKFQQAHGGTIFLDEIGEMPLDLQTFLLRVLEEGEVVRLGGRKSIRLNVRVIAATNQDLLTAIENGKFRRDLYYRLNILSLRVPSLRERPTDIGLLLDHHLHRARMDIGRSPLTVDPEALPILEAYHWPGNVRELRNFAYRMVTKVVGDKITVRNLPPEIVENGKRKEFSEKDVQSSHFTVTQHQPTEKSSLKDHELQMILKVLKDLNGNVTETARKLGIHRSTIYRKLGKNPLQKY
ncbi:sigma-54-dependent Fis family transcriptional regulator [Ammoniphilus sp. 3BR4]|uniref:sigma-54-dependent Fis family transcriptional regulator n=1 Tax=Ammoniphilus sp. 3BR4 TaxID=3158265 RepID=UPI0034668FAE